MTQSQLKSKSISDSTDQICLDLFKDLKPFTGKGKWYFDQLLFSKLIGELCLIIWTYLKKQLFLIASCTVVKLIN